MNNDSKTALINNFIKDQERSLQSNYKNITNLSFVLLMCNILFVMLLNELYSKETNPLSLVTMCFAGILLCRFWYTSTFRIYIDIKSNVNIINEYKKVLSVNISRKAFSKNWLSFGSNCFILLFIPIYIVIIIKMTAELLG